MLEFFKLRLLLKDYTIRVAQSPIKGGLAIDCVAVSLTITPNTLQIIYIHIGTYFLYQI